jgi:glycogen debranching enzyme
MSNSLPSLPHDEIGPFDEPTEAEFYIPAVGPVARSRRVLKHNDTFAVLDSHGDIGAAGDSPNGLFVGDTRHLSQLELLCQGVKPLLLSSTISDNTLGLSIDLTNPDYYERGTLVLHKDIVHISRFCYLLDHSLRQRITLVNYGVTPVEITLAVIFNSDFADIFEVRGIRRPKRGTVSRRLVDSSRVELTYVGLDEVPRKTTVTLTPAPSRLATSAATFAIRLATHQRQNLVLVADCGERTDRTPAAYFRGLRARLRARQTHLSHSAMIETDNSILNEVLARSSSDLDMLLTETADGPYPYAGVPWYSTTFGRDGLIAALQLLWVTPNVAAGVLRRLARLQAIALDPAADAEPGKILHEMRQGEMAALGEVPFGRYYGSVDATPLFVVLAGAYLRRSGDTQLIREIWPAIDRALNWIETTADRDGDGFIEYQRAEELGLSNQGWKDSYDSVFHADGALASGPISLVESQCFAYAARRAGAACARSVGDELRANILDGAADRLRLLFHDAFWDDRLGLFVLALDGQKSPCAVRTSNAAYALFAGIATPEQAAQMGEVFATRNFWSGWGVRTVAEGEARYNPMSYHNGSVWPHDNAIIAAGLAQYGQMQMAEQLFEGLMRAASYFDQRRIPELFCGFRRKPGRGPTLYPVACAPQAWSAGAPFMMLQAMLGIEFDAEAREIRLRNPRVPAIAQGVTVRNLALGNARADFALTSAGSGVSLNVLRTSGPVRVILTFDERRTQD